MKILAPVNSVEEAEVLIAVGAQELYCGLHPSVRGHGDGMRSPASFGKKLSHCVTLDICAAKR